MIHVVTFRWGDKYGPEYVERLRAGVARNLKANHRFLCIGDDMPIENPELLSVRDGCYVRLRCFDPEWQARHGIERLVWLDLDVVITGPLDPLFCRPEALVVLRGGHFNPNPINGSVLMLKAGAHPEIWHDFTVEHAEKVSTVKGFWRGSDQTWIAHKMPADTPGWTHTDGVYGFKKPGWPNRNGNLPGNARIVIFPGHRDPAHMLDELAWVRQHWAP